MGDAIKSKKKKYNKTKKDLNYDYINNISTFIKEISNINPFQNTRKREVIEIRSLLIYIMRDIEGMTYESIKNYFIKKGRKMDHATALHSYVNYPIYSRYNKKLDEYFDKLLDASTTEKIRKQKAKNIIDQNDPAIAELFIYMCEKNTIDELQQ